MDIKYLVILIVAFAVMFLVMGTGAYFSYRNNRRTPVNWSEKDRQAAQALCRVYHLDKHAVLARDKTGKLFVYQGTKKLLQLSEGNFPTLPRKTDVALSVVLNNTEPLLWKPEERALAQSMRAVLGGEYALLERAADGTLTLRSGQEAVTINDNLFPTLRPGNVTRLVDIPEE